MILITGATGRTGSAVIADLVSRGLPVRALVLHRDEGEEVLGPLLGSGGSGGSGVELVVADYVRPDTLPAAMDGVDRVFLVAPGSPRLVDHESNVIDAAARVGVSRVVKVSGLGAAADSPFSITRWHAESERRLRASGLGWTMLRPNFFMQNFLFMFAPRIASEGAIYAPVGDGRISMVDYRDVAAVAAEVLTGSGHEGATYEITGPEALSMPAAGEVVAGVIGRPVRHVDLPPEEARRDMIEQRVRPPFADALLGLFASFRDGRAALVTDVVRRVGGRSPRTFGEFVREHSRELAAGG